MFSYPPPIMFPGSRLQLQPCLPALLTHTSTMMTMSLGDEAPWIYLSRRSLS